MILDRIHRKHFPATRPLGTDGSRAADKAPPWGVFNWLRSIWCEWKADFRRVFVEDASDHDFWCPCETCRSPRQIGEN